MQTATLAAAVALPVALLLADAAGAASCREALEDFERKLNESSLAATDPETYAEFAREAANAAELRDEQVCMQRVAELNAALPADVNDPVAGTQSSTEARRPAPPAAPVLLDEEPADYEVESSSEKPGEPPANEDDRQ